MLFFLAVDLWLANEASLKQVPQISRIEEVPIEKVLPVDSDQQDSVEEGISFESEIQVKPFVLEGSVESFDPVLRAAELAKTISRNWCGIYRSFEDDETIKVSLNFLKVRPIGQTVHLEGEMFLDGISTLISGNLNAKSDQLELIPLFDNSTAGLEPGGYFVGLQGAKVFGWKSPRLDNPGGKLELQQVCDDHISKALILRSIW